MNAVLDTCALLDLLLVRYRPPLPAPWYASAISWCEIAWKHRIGRLSLGDDRDLFFAHLQAAGVVVVPIDHHQALAAVDLDWDHRDPADRLIVALARERQLPLITRDHLLRRFHPDCCW